MDLDLAKVKPDPAERAKIYCTKVREVKISSLALDGFFLILPAFHYNFIKKKQFAWVQTEMSSRALQMQQSGAVEACWAHNPEVRGSKPRSASRLLTGPMRRMPRRPVTGAACTVCS